MIRKMLISSLILFSGFSSLADNLPAKNCQIYIRRLQALPSSHGSASLNVFVKVAWLGNDEFIESVGLNAMNNDTSYNSPNCSWNSRPNGSWYIQYPNSGSGYSSTEYGEYVFNLPIKSGSVGGPCSGTSYTTIGTFFVQTNKNTYWLNPDMDANKYFYFDENGLRNIMSLGGTYNNIFTDRSDMRYYNPADCQR